MVCEVSKIPKGKRAFFDMRVCPDCGKVQIHKKDMVNHDHCENPNCESYVQVFNHKGSKMDGMLCWNNDNWG